MFFCRSNSGAAGLYKKESVELIFRLFTIRLWKDLTKINATMPHTWIVWGDTQIAYSHMTIQEMSAVRSSFGLENFHIFL